MVTQTQVRRSSVTSKVKPRRESTASSYLEAQGAFHLSGLLIPALLGTALYCVGFWFCPRITFAVMLLSILSIIAIYFSDSHQETSNKKESQS